MSVFGAVMERLAAGESPRQAARTLAIRVDVAQAVADEAARMGLVLAPAEACGTCVPASKPGCAGCPFSR
ncbi:hypothetical protein [Demequina pelophila]|uniref:hypothetical protein n=1 Tax=Demequina pelophila TaxID=1638984 RepID=UPI00078274D9|nr:hypothetical protein [Demequina pelophila]